MKMYFIEISTPWLPVAYAEALPVGRTVVQGPRHRHIVGTSAFECLRVAVHHREVRLRRLVADTYLRRLQTSSWQHAKMALNEIDRIRT